MVRSVHTKMSVHVSDQSPNTSEKRSLTEIFGKNSFDRFGDDLTEDILNYLPFEKKFIFRCLSKHCKFCLEENLTKTQWVYIRSKLRGLVQTPLEKMELIARYCPNVTGVEYCQGTIRDVFHLVLENWPNLREVRFTNFYGIRPEDMDRFVEQYGPHLKRLHYAGSLREMINRNTFTKILSSCPNLESVTDECLWDDRHWFMLYMGLSLDTLFDNNELLVTKLNKLLFEHVKSEEKLLTRVVEANKNTLKMVKVLISTETIESMASLFDDLLLLSNLTEISIKTKLCPLTEKYFTERFSQLTESCPAITKIYLNLTYVLAYGSIAKSLFYTFESFPNLKHLGLNISLPFDNYTFVTNEPPRAPKALVTFDLKVYSMHSRLKDKFFERLVQQFPNLQRLVCLQVEDLSTEMLKSLSKLKKLKLIEVEAIHCTATNKQITQGLKDIKKLTQLNLRWTYGRLRPVYKYYPVEVKLPLFQNFDIDH